MRRLLQSVPISLLHPLLHAQTHKALHGSRQDYLKFKKSFLSLDPETVELLREKYLLYTFQRNVAEVPQYRRFLHQKGINPVQIKSKVKSKEDFISNVPETTKKKYIFTARQLQDLCVQDGQHRMNMIVKSSGHSGRQCYWAKSHREDLFGRAALTMALDENFNISSKRTLIINGFILGTWVTGITFNEFASALCTVINVGPYWEEILQIMQEIGGQFEQIIITGYPPFIKELVEYGLHNRFPWKKYKLHFIAGGEDFPESWRRYIREKSGARKIRAGFGASDIGILGGVETDDTVFIRQLADSRPEIRKALFGEVEETPMLFQYGLNVFIQANKQQELVFTTILPEAVEPVINYNLEDVGGVISCREMQEKLRLFHRPREFKGFKLPLPFLYVIGRSHGPVKFHAFFVYPENVEECIYRNPPITKTTTGNFRLQRIVTKDQDHFLQLEFQLKKGIAKSPSLTQKYRQCCRQTLQDVNGGYKAIHQQVGKIADPIVILYPYEKYPYQSKIKNVYS